MKKENKTDIKTSKYNFRLFDIKIPDLRKDQLSKSFCGQQKQYFGIGCLSKLKHSNFASHQYIWFEEGLKNKKKQDRI